MKFARFTTRWFFARQLLIEDNEYRFWNSRAWYSLTMYIPYVLFWEEKFCPRFVIRCLMEPCFCDDSRQTFVLPRSIITRRFFSVPRHCTAHRTNRVVLSTPITFHANRKDYTRYSNLFLPSLRLIIRASNRCSHIADNNLHTFESSRYR